MARIARILATATAALVLMVFGASAASASTATSVPVVGVVFAGTDVDGTTADMITTASDCWAAVTTDADGEIVFRDYATTTDGTAAPLTFCEGEQGPRFLVEYAGDLAAEDGMPYVIGAQV